MSIDLMSTVTITAPAASDGRGEVAVLNDSASGNFVGLLFDASGFDGPPVRTSQDLIPEGHGATFGSFWHGPRSLTLEILLSRASSWANSMTRRDKLYRATNAMAANGTIVYTETGGSARLINFRREQPPRGPDKDGKVLLSFVAADPRIYANTATTGSSPTTNAGTMSSPPTFTLTPTGGDVVITNTTTSQALTLTVGGGTGVSTGSAVTVDFGQRTVTQSTRKDAAVQFPSSVWWEVVPGSNSWTVTNASSVSISVRSAWL